MKFCVTIIVALMSLSFPALADESDHSAELLTLLSAIDTVPSAQDFHAVSLDPSLDLFFAADDPKLDIYLRRRAASLLSLFYSPQSRAYLLTLTLSGPLRLRWIATYTYCRAWSNRTTSHVLSFARVMLKSKEALIRDAVVRGLAYVNSSAADALLRQQQLVEKDKNVLRAIQRVQMRRKRSDIPLR